MVTCCWLSSDGRCLVVRGSCLVVVLRWSVFVACGSLCEFRWLLVVGCWLLVVVCMLCVLWLVLFEVACW